MIREPWDQRIDEPSAEYRQFLWWRDQVPRPEPSDLELAQYYDWSGRAASWDAHRSVPARIDDQLDVGLASLGEAFALKARHELAQIRLNPDHPLDPKLASVAKALAQIKILVLESRARLGERTELGEVERLTEDLSEDEQRVLLKLLEKGA